MAEKEYIERGALIGKMFPIGMPNDGAYPINAKAVRTAIEQIPAADVVEVRHGEWIDTSKYINGLYNPQVNCSVCGHIFWHLSAQTYNYCPACGAKMDGERKEQK